MSLTHRAEDGRPDYGVPRKHVAVPGDVLGCHTQVGMTGGGCKPDLLVCGSSELAPDTSSMR